MVVITFRPLEIRSANLVADVVDTGQDKENHMY